VEQEEPAATAIRMVDGKEEFSIRFDKEDSVVAIREVGSPKNLGSLQESVIEAGHLMEQVLLEDLPKSRRAEIAQPGPRGPPAALEKVVVENSSTADPLQKSMGNLGGDEIARRIKSKLT
jgi:hypothetical protein